MKKIKSLIKKNGKLLLGIIIGGVISGGGVYAVAVSSSSVNYSNSTSGLAATNVQKAINELYEKAKSLLVAGYTYNQTSGASNHCVTGGESTCAKTTCYKNKTAGSCPKGTIIDYKVNNSTIVRFHVMYDNGSTMTMQSQSNTINNTHWYGTSDTTQGPKVILPALENATSGWSNVNNQTYAMGTTSLSGKGAYTGCTTIDACTTNVYTLPERTAKARMITFQEAADLGCTRENNSCPIWMYNFLNGNTEYTATAKDSASHSGYWTMTANRNTSAWRISTSGYLGGSHAPSNSGSGARAVVVVSKW